LEEEVIGLKESMGLSKILESGRFIDLTYLLSENTPTYPNSIHFSISEKSNIKKNGRKTSKIILGTHTGTHIDTPAHLFLKGKSVEDIPLKMLTGEALMLSLKKTEYRKGLYTFDDLNGRTKYIDQVDILIIKSGDSRTEKGRSRLFSEYLVPDRSVLNWITEHKLKCFGTDAISFDPVNASPMENHVLLLGKKIILAEGLFNLDKIDRDVFYFMVIPLKIEGADGAPCRAFSIMV